MLIPFIDLLSNLLQLYLVCVIVWTIISTLAAFKIINAYQPVVSKVLHALDRLCEPALKPIRKFMPDLGGFDISPVILILLINFAQGMLYRLYFIL